MPSSAPPAVAPPPPVAPFTAVELRALARRPDRAFDLLLGSRERLAATVGDERPPWLLAAVLLATTALASLPYGLVHGGLACWKIGALFGGSVLLCWPSLQVFGAYLGRGLQPAQSLALALVISCVAALFTLGFFPILWFLQVTMEHGDRIDAADASLGMIVFALLAGLLQLTRCAAENTRLRANRSLPLLLVWQALVVFVALRMARALALFP